MSGAKRKSYIGAFKLMYSLKILETRAGRECGICEKNIAQDRLGLQGNTFVLPCSMAQDRLGLAFFSCCAGSDGYFIWCLTLGA